MSESAQTRSLKLDLIPPEEQRHVVLDSIRRYRAICRQCYAVLLLSQAAGAKVEEHPKGLRLKPDNDKSKQLLALATGKEGKALAYELRDYVLREQWPTVLSFVWDSIRRDVTTVWSSGDPEYPQAARGYLALQGARGVAQFQRRGIGFPLATGRPKLNGHTVTLKWDHDVGAICFSVPRLDGGRYAVWRALRDKEEGWSIGTIYLSERDRLIFATVTYSRPPSLADVDPKRILRLAFGEEMESFLGLAGPHGAPTYDSISGAAALAWLQRSLRRRQDFEERRQAAGSPRQPWGNRRDYGLNTERLQRLTLLRQRRISDWNHAWTRRIVSRAVSWRCGTIRVGKEPEDFFGQPWNWTGFFQDLEYKSCERGILVDYEDSLQR
jgi:hypothetical protein